MVKKRFLFHWFRNRSSWVSASLLGMLLLGQAASVRADETKDFQVSDDDDDAEERVSNGNMSLGSSDLEMIRVGGNDQIVGIRFRNINIPQGATILRAWIEFEADESDSGATNLTIHGEDIDDAPIFTNSNSNISNRTTTTASVSWSPGAWSTNDRNETPDLSGIVQEIVDRAGWASDNDMVFIISGSGARVAEAHDGEDENAPILRIEIQGSASTPGGALCWSVDDGANNLRIVDTSDGTVDTTIGDTGVSSIEAIAIDPNGLSIYAADRDQLGRLNPDTGEFIRLIQPFGTGDDGSGNFEDFDDVDSLSFDSNGVLWGVNASGGDDELFQIDPDTGAFVPDAFGPGIDYVTISGSGIGSSIDDIAIDPSTGTMYGADTNNSQLITINTTTGAGTVVGGYGGTPDMEGMAFHFDGTLYGTALQQMFTVNTSTGAATQIGTGNTLTPGSDYEAFDCNYTALTRVVISRFTSQGSGSNVVVEWETASEEGTAGFYLYRFDSRTRRWKVLNEQILPALQEAPQGGRYRWLDETAPSDVDSQGWYYGLLEVEAGGRMAGHGPYFHQVGGSGDALEPPGGFLRQVRRSARQLRRDAWRRQRRKRDATNKSPRRQNRGPALKIRASEKGLYYVDAVRMAQTLGVDYSVDWVLARIARQRVSLTRHGKDVAWYLASTGDRIVFYSEGYRDLYGGDDVLRLRFGRGAVMGEEPVANPRNGETTASFEARVLREEDVFPGIAVGPDPESDYWFWSYLNAGDARFNKKSISVTTPALAGSGVATVIVELYGATTSGLQDEHRVDVRVNGQFVGTTRFKGMGTHRAEFELPQQALAESENEVELEAVLEGAPYSILYVDGVEVRYARRYVADGNRLWFHDAGNPIVSPRGFTSSDLIVLDISDSDRPRRLSITAQGLGDFSFDMVPRVGSRYVAVAADTIDPAGVEPWDQPASQLHGRHSIDYLVITHESLRGGAEALADYRRSTGLDSMVVTVEEIENEFASGFPTPHAIRDFLRYTNDRWLRAPRYVVLVGEGSWDYRNVYGLSDSLVPPLMELGTNGIYASDNSLADVVGDDALPEMAIGRIPVATAEELDAYLAKVRAFEARGRDERLLLLSDTDDRGGLFQEDVRSIAPTNTPLQEISLNDLPIAAARSAFLTALGEGGGVVAYSGHGGLDRLAMGGLMLSSDVAQLRNLDRLPILISMSCSTNRFSVTGFDSLGENLVQEETGGAIAVWAPTGLTAHAQTMLLVGPFMERVYGDSERLGDAVLGALQDYAQKADSERLLTVFTLLGDPALRIN